MYKISHSWVDMVFFYFPFFLNCVSGQMWFSDGSNKGTVSNFVQNLEKMRRTPWQWLDKCSEKKAWAVLEKYKLTETEKRQGRRRASQDYTHNFFTPSGLFKENLSWQAKQSIPHAPVTFYSNCMKMCKDFATNFGGKRTGCCIMTVHRLTLPFSSGNFWTKNNMTVIIRPSYSPNLAPSSFLYFPDWR
jgi:hypothetical protein